jgi:hypothetical protein
MTLSFGCAAHHQTDAPSTQRAEAHVKLVGMRIANPPAQLKNGEGSFSLKAGTHLQLLAHLPSGGIYDFDRDASHITFLGGVRGQVRPTQQNHLRFDRHGAISADRKAVLLSARTNLRPSRGSSLLQIRGQVRIKTFRKTTEYTKKNIELKRDSSFNLAGYNFALSIRHTGLYPSTNLNGDQKAGGNKTINEYTVDATANIPSKRLVEMELLGEDGKPFRSFKTGEEKTFPNEKLTLKLKLREGIKTRTIPFDIKTGVGF